MHNTYHDTGSMCIDNGICSAASCSVILSCTRFGLEPSADSGSDGLPVKHLGPATGHAGMEALVANLLEPGETIIVGNNGASGVCWPFSHTPHRYMFTAGQPAGEAPSLHPKQ